MRHVRDTQSMVLNIAQSLVENRAKKRLIIDSPIFNYKIFRSVCRKHPLADCNFEISR